jgi:uncharacterized repeat protein (TIGR01451 family)
MSKLSVLAAGLLVAPILAFSTSAFAAGMGQIEGGDIYRVKNVTKNVDFTDPASATCGDTVQFKVRIHNPGPSALENVKVVATLPSVVATKHVSTVTVSSAYADPNSTSDTATVNLDKAGKLTYVAGSTELLDAHNGKLSTLGDTVLSSGVTIGHVGVSIEEKRFVQFQAKITCDTQKEECKPGIPVGDVRCKEVPTTLVNTGAGDVLGIVAAVTVAGALAHRLVLARRS